MIDDPRVEELLEELLESGGSPEEACRACPELLPRVRARLLRVRLLEQELGAVFPRSETPACVRPAPAAVRAAADPRLRGGGGAGPRRDGGRLPGAAPAAQPPRRPQDAPGRGLRPAGGAGSVPPRGAGRGGPAAPERRAGPRRSASWTGCRTSPWNSSRGAAWPRSWPARRYRPARPRLCRRRWPRPLQAAHRSGIIHRDLKPAQHPARRRRHAQDRRLRAGPAAGRRWRC